MASRQWSVVRRNPGELRFQLNNGRPIAVKPRQGCGGDAAGPPKTRRKHKRSTRGAQEEHKRNTRGTQESASQSPGLCLACAWLVPGLCLALGAFAPQFCILHSSFCIRPSVALRALPSISSFIIHHSAFPPGCLCAARSPRQPIIANADISGGISSALTRTHAHPWRRNTLKNCLSGNKIPDSLATVGRSPNENQERKHKLNQGTNNQFARLRLLSVCSLRCSWPGPLAVVTVRHAL